MIMLLKMHASGTIFDKTCLKTIKSFFSICDLLSGDNWTQIFSGFDIQQKGKVQTFWLAGRLLPLSSSS